VATFNYNPITNQLDLVGSGGSVIDGEVATFADLPQTAGTPPVGSSYLVRESTGVWLVNRRQAGIYIRTNNTGVRADDWTYGGDFPVQSVNGEIGTVILDGSDLDTSGNDDLAAFVTYEFADGNGIYYPLPDVALNSRRTYRAITGHYVFFENLRWHITDGSPITANIIESSDDDNAAWPWLSAWDGSIEKAKLSTIVGRARDTFLFVGDSVPSTSVSGLGTAATADSTAFAAASHKSSHSTGGADAVAPSDIGAQSIFLTEDLGTVTANVTLTAARAKIYTVNTTTSGLRILLPTTGVMAGDVVIIEFLSSTGQTLTPMRGSISSGFFTDNLRPTDRATFIAASTSATSWYEDRTISRFAAESIFSGTVDVARLPVGTGSTQVAAGNHTHVVADVTGAAASGSITSSGLTQATARILGRTSSSAGSIEEIQIGAGLSLSAGELSATSSGGVSSVDSTTADVLSVSGSNLVADDGGLIDSANPFIQWNDTSGKLVYANPLARPSGAGSMFIGLAPSTTALGTGAINIQTARGAATRVASNTNSIAIGNEVTASGDSATAIGNGTNCSASGTRAIAIGRGLASGNDSICISTSVYDATSANAIAMGFGAARATAAVSIGGLEILSSGVNAVGLNANANLRGMFGALPFSVVYWGGSTTNATATVLNLDATATSRFTIAANTALAVDILLVARRSDTADKWLVARRFLGIRRDGSNNTALIGTVQTLGTDQSAGSPTWTFALTADDTNEALQLEVTGAASETIQWRATAFYRVA
jgi:phage gp37-like protein